MRGVSERGRSSLPRRLLVMSAVSALLSVSLPAAAVGTALAAPDTLAVAKDSSSNSVSSVSGSGFIGTVTASVAVGSGVSNVTASGAATVTGNGSDLVTITGSLADVNATLASLTYTPAAGYTGSVTMTITMLEGSGSLYSSDTGHYYEYVTVGGGITWTAAKAAAALKTLAGRTGYLVTVTSAEENEFIRAKLLANAWMGASDAATEGTWKWVTGPESGTTFFVTGAGSQPGYSNWNAGEPNDFGSGEDAGQFYTTGKWNDLPDSGHSLTGYVVEYGGLGGDTPTDVSRTVAITVYGVPFAPTGISATGNDASALLSWTAPGSPAEGPPTGYRIQTSTDGSSWTTAIENTGSASTSAAVTGLTNGTLYYFRIAGINGAGLGEFSSSAPATPFKPEPACSYNPASYLDADAGWTVPCWVGPSSTEGASDVADWQEDAAAFGIANRLVVASDDGRINPSGTITRGDAANLFRRLAGDPLGAASHPFSDAPVSANAALDWLASIGAVEGVGGGMFDAERPITRVETVVLIWRLAGKPTPSGAHGFPDTDLSWANNALAWAKEAGVAKGRSNGDFEPDAAITRGELLVMVYRWTLGIESAAQ